jgi:hypothetical protein
MVMFVFLCISCILFSTPTSATTADDLKKMKMKDLKQFLSERDEECNGCSEKSEFLNLAIRVMNKKPDAAKKAAAGFSGPAPTNPLWEVWAGFADEISKEEGLSESQVKAVHNVVENAFMQHGKATATKLKKTHKDVLKTSLLSPYYNVGRKHLKALAKFALTKGEKPKADVLRTAYDKVFLPWMTNVGIENTNPMYEWMKSKNDEL